MKPLPVAQIRSAPCCAVRLQSSSWHHLHSRWVISKYIFQNPHYKANLNWLMDCECVDKEKNCPLPTLLWMSFPTCDMSQFNNSQLSVLVRRLMWRDEGVTERADTWVQSQLFGVGFIGNIVYCVPNFSAVLCQKPEEHLWALLLCPEGCSSPNRTPVLPRGKGGKVYLLIVNRADIFILLIIHIYSCPTTCQNVFCIKYLLWRATSKKN